MPPAFRDLQDLKEAVRARSDIVEVVGQYTRLKRSGKSWTGLCPFHADKKPSFSVHPPTQTYVCWSCGEKGDVFTFTQKKENIDFMGALEFLARRAGIPFEFQSSGGGQQPGERERMLELNEFAVRYYQERLERSDDARAYLAKRGILKDTQEKFLVGFAPDDWEALARDLERRKQDVELAVKLGLIKARTQEGYGHYDAFRNRLIFPIQDSNGRVIGFGARAMGDGQPKYLNSEESPLFQKSRTLYGLNFARKVISEERPAVFVEGYVDVITTHQAGFSQCVATLGTSMTEEHARLLVRFGPKVIICYDGDQAGIKATLRGASVWEGMAVEGAEVRVAKLPEGEDPDSLLFKGDTAGFQAALDSAVPRVDFQIDLVMAQNDTRTDEGRERALEAIVPILATVGKRSQRGGYAQKIAGLHPLHHVHGGGRAIEQILADVDEYAKRNPDSPRDQGYPRTERQNGKPLTRQPNVNSGWGRSPEEWPHTRAVVRRNAPEQTGAREPSSRIAPILSGPEKAERQLLLALFTADWRVYVLSRLRPDQLLTPHGRTLFRLVAAARPNEEGVVEPMEVIRLAEMEDAASNAVADPESQPVRDDESTAVAGLTASKLSDFIASLMEDSTFWVSNAQISETVVIDCIDRVRKQRETESQRELAGVLRYAETLPPEERRAVLQQLQQRVRKARGSAPTAPAD